MAVHRILPVFGIVLLVLAIVFMARGQTALGASFIAIAMSQIAIFAALSAKAKSDAAKGEDN